MEKANLEMILVILHRSLRLVMDDCSEIRCSWERISNLERRFILGSGKPPSSEENRHETDELRHYEVGVDDRKPLADSRDWLGAASVFT